MDEQMGAWMSGLMHRCVEAKLLLNLELLHCQNNLPELLPCPKIKFSFIG